MEKNPQAEATREKFEEIDKSHDTQSKEIVELNNQNLARRSQEGKDKALCTRCGNVLTHKTHGYCDECTALRVAGEIPPLQKAEPDYDQRQCKCGNWFEPTSARGLKCKKCKEGEPMTTKTNTRKRYSAPAKALFLRKVNELRSKGANRADACKEAGKIALGREGNGFSYDKWSVDLGITKWSAEDGLVGGGVKNATPLREGNKIVSPYTLEQRAAFIDAVDAEMEKGVSKGKACRAVGKAMLGKEREVWHYRDYSQAVRGNTGKRGNMGTHKRVPGASRSPYPEEKRIEFVERVKDMHSRDIPLDKAVKQASVAILGTEVTKKQYQNWKSSQNAKAEKMSGVAAVKQKAKAAGGLSLELVTTWLADVEDADELIGLQEALDARKQIVHKRVEEETEKLLAQLDKLSIKKPTPKTEASNDVLPVEQSQSANTPA